MVFYNYFNVVDKELKRIADTLENDLYHDLKEEELDWIRLQPYDGDTE